MSTPCSLLWQPQFAYGLCRCHQWAILSCPSREDALAKWESQHMQPTPCEEVHHAQ